MFCNLKASNETAMMIEVFQGLGVIQFLVNAWGVFFSVNSKSYPKKNQKSII